MSGARDIVAGTAIYDVVVCHEPRRFQLAHPMDIPDTTDGHGTPSRYILDVAMPHGSILQLTAFGNATIRHRVPKEPGWTGTRYSIVMRTVKVVG